jgi:hypothetical protein
MIVPRILKTMRNKKIVQVWQFFILFLNHILYDPFIFDNNSFSEIWSQKIIIRVYL